MDTTLFIKRKHNDILLVRIYVDDIIFGSTNDSLCKEFSLDMQKWIWNVNDGRTIVLPGITNQANSKRYIHQSSQVQQGIDQKIWDGKCKTHGYTDEH